MGRTPLPRVLGVLLAAVLAAGPIFAQTAAPGPDDAQGSAALSQSGDITAGDLDALYTGSIQRAPLAVAPPEGVPPDQDMAAVAARGASLLAQPGLRIASDIPGVRAGPVPQSDIDRYIDIQPGRELTLWEKAARSAMNTVAPGSGASFETHEERFTRQVLAKLNSSPTGREVLRQAVNEARLSGKKITIMARDYPGSEVTVEDGVEKVTLTRGTSWWNQFKYTYNRNFTKMEDEDLAMETMAGNASHELQHIIWGHKTRRTLQKYKDIMHYCLSNEMAARLKGYLVGMELNKGDPTPYTAESRGVVNAGMDYLEGMKTWSENYAWRLTAEDMADPVAANKDAKRRIQRRIDSKKDYLKVQLPRFLRQLHHLETAHGLKDRLTELRGELESDLRSTPLRIKDLQDAVARLDKQIAYFKSPAGRPTVRLMRQASADPEFQALEKDVQADIDKLQELADEKGIPEPAGTPGQIRWEEFTELIEKCARENPAHADALK